MIKRLISEFLDEETRTYYYIVRVFVFGISVYSKQIESSRIDLINQFVVRNNKIGFKDENKDKRDN